MKQIQYRSSILLNKCREKVGQREEEYMAYTRGYLLLMMRCYGEVDENMNMEKNIMRTRCC